MYHFRQVLFKLNKFCLGITRLVKKSKKFYLLSQLTICSLNSAKAKNNSLQLFSQQNIQSLSVLVITTNYKYHSILTTNQKILNRFSLTLSVILISIIQRPLLMNIFCYNERVDCTIKTGFKHTILMYIKLIFISTRRNITFIPWLSLYNNNQIIGIKNFT